MRYIGNKTRLLPFILRTLKRSQIGVGSVHDAFAGTASVSRALKAKGWRVHSSDLLMSSYVFQRAYVVADHGDPLLDDMAGGTGVPGPAAEGFISRHFSPTGGVGEQGKDVLHPGERRANRRRARGAGKLAKGGEGLARTATICCWRRLSRVRTGSPTPPACMRRT